MKKRIAYTLYLEGTTPDTLPIGKLAEYLQGLEGLAKGTAELHMTSIKKGSFIGSLSVEAPFEAAFSDRIHRIREGTAPKEAQKAEKQINELFGAHGIKGSIRKGGKHGQLLLDLPGRQKIEKTPTILSEETTLQGRLCSISSNAHGRVSAALETTEFGRITGTLKKTLAKNIAHYLFEDIRIEGSVTWKSNDLEKWSISTLHISDFTHLDRGSLWDNIKNIQEMAQSWPDDIIDAMNSVRGDEGE